MVNRNASTLLHTGTYGVVYKAYIASGQDAGKFVALKKIRLEDEDNGVPSAALWEIASLKRANHANVVSLLVMHPFDRVDAC